MSERRRPRQGTPPRGEPGGDAYTTAHQVEDEQEERARDEAAVTRPSDLEPGTEDAPPLDEETVTEPRHVEGGG